MKLTVHFDGLCHFVPFYKDFASDKVNLEKMWVILVNGRNTMEIPFTIRGQVNATALHYAFVRVGAGHLASGQPADLMGLWPIHETDLEVLDLNEKPLDAGGLRLKRVEPKDPRAPELGTDEETSYHWVADLGEAEQNHGRVLADSLEEDDLRLVPTTIASARVRLLAGEVSTGFVVRNSDPDTMQRIPIVFRMTGGPREFSQALAERVTWRVTVPTDGIVLVRKHRQNGSEERLTLKGQDDRLELFIGNLEASSILAQRDHRTFETRISEFLWFYSLSPNKLKSGVTFPVPEAETLPKDGDPYCPVSSSRQP